MDLFYMPGPPEEDFDALMEQEEELNAVKRLEKETSKENTNPVQVADDELEDIFDGFDEKGEVSQPVTHGSPQAKKPKLDVAPPRDPVVVRTTVSSVSIERPVYRIPQIGERKVYRKRPQDGEYQGVTMANGDRFYLRFKGDGEHGSTEAHRSAVSGLCGVPYGVLFQHALREQATMNQAQLVGETRENGGASMLWVEKFRPKNFMQLLSDDGTNRKLLRWLKLWDKAVFNRESKRQKPATAEKDDKPPAATDVVETLDSTGRPVQKVALLHGPPGLGKTTLAHVIASTAGYNVVEMNASDDRSVSKFKERFEAATQMRSVMDADRKPNCLVVDEIDGSPAATIQFLVGALTSKKAKRPTLQRPVICICNDLYVPALRPLRQHALIVPFPPTLSARLAQRLQEISTAERLKADQTALLALAEKTDNDIRACLSTLQFFKSRGKALKAVDVHRTCVGQKDSQTSHFSVWRELFSVGA